MAESYKALSTQGIRFLKGESMTTLEELCRIKDYPDLVGDPNLIDVTDLMDSQQSNIFGVATSDTLGFTANYTESAYKKVKNDSGELKAGYYGLMLSDGTGWYWQGYHRTGVPGHSADEAVEFKVNVVNSGDVLFGKFTENSGSDGTYTVAENK